MVVNMEVRIAAETKANEYVAAHPALLDTAADMYAALPSKDRNMLYEYYLAKERHGDTSATPYVKALRAVRKGAVVHRPETVAKKMGDANHIASLAD